VEQLQEELNGGNITKPRATKPRNRLR